MLILLPPSESKAPPPRRGAPVALDRLSFPELGPARQQLLTLVAEASGRPDAVELLGVGPSLAREVARNTALAGIPTRPVSATYTGVLYEALGWETLDAAARRRAARRLVVVSALWGAVRPGDRVPAYRLSMGVDLPGAGPLAGYWRPLLGAVLTAAAGSRGVVVDCRSATYAAAWTPSGPLAERTAAVRVLRQSPDGSTTVVSHLAKHTRGEVARVLLESGAEPRRVPELATVLAEAGAGHWKVEASRPRAGRPWQLDLVLPG